ncbi:uncharacterized protein N7484_007408 [Penicillium longicatenatum]|uniref:uncharacterized protein n=1 Tax=Penicillium longicatenatum TaxID=1561947 RepID=UPI002547BF09|nr:uncharacterized protein N7484_007408 [Penicillium longicatenatum]KAJ5639546.1 hypothetical protein N7484_007408 [Penicillium longicatenatum]
MRSISLFLLFHSALSFTPCPLLGPTYPPFKLETRDPIIVDSLKNLTESFDELMRTGIGENGPITKNTTTLGMALFSANNGNAQDEPFFWQYHYTAPEYKKIIRRSQNVTKDSIYRIGGLTEVFTVWSLLLTVGDKIFNDPVTKYLPELANGSSTATSISHTKWDEITVGQIASHMAGTARNYCSHGVTLPKNISKGGLPDRSAFNLPCCSIDSKCSQSEFIQQLAKRAPVAPAGTTPAYSNMGFQLLGYIIERHTGHSFEDLVQNKIFDPLGLNKTTIFAPKHSKDGVIPVDQEASGWSSHLPGSEASTSIFTSVEDLALAGKAILKSTLLSSAQTNRWLKPVSHTANPKNSVGYPFLIYSGGDYPDTSPMIDVYTLLSNEGYEEGLYSSYLGLVPDWGVGYAILSADTVRPADLNEHADYMQTALNGVITTAVQQAARNYSGRYISSGSSTSYIVVDYEKRTPWGLYIEDFVSNGTDLRKTLSELFGVSHASDLSIRLYPTGLSEETGSGSRQTFRAVFQDETELADNGTPTCVSWLELDKYQYAGHGLDEFIFTLNAQGEAVRVEIPALNVTLQKR